MPRVKLYDENEVLERAMHLFWEKGYHATSIQDLVTHLGIHRGSLYDTFGDKKELYYKALNHYRTLNVERIISFFDDNKNVKEGFRKLLKQAVNESVQEEVSRGCFIVNSTTELASLDQEVQKIVGNSQVDFIKIFTDYIESGKTSGEISMNINSPAAAQMIFTFYNGIRVLGKTQKQEDDWMASIDTILEIL